MRKQNKNEKVIHNQTKTKGIYMSHTTVSSGIDKEANGKDTINPMEIEALADQHGA